MGECGRVWERGKLIKLMLRRGELPGAHLYTQGLTKATISASLMLNIRVKCIGHGL